MNSERNSMKSPIAQFVGGAVTNTYGILNPVGFGRKTKLILTEDRLIEVTKKFVASRYCEIRVSCIDSVEIVEQGITFLLFLGFGTLWLYGIGIIFIVLYFFFKNKYLVIHSRSNVMAVQVLRNNSLSSLNEFVRLSLNQSDASVVQNYSLPKSTQKSFDPNPGAKTKKQIME